MSSGFVTAAPTTRGARSARRRRKAAAATSTAPTTTTTTTTSTQQPQQPSPAQSRPPTKPTAATSSSSTKTAQSKPPSQPIKQNKSTVTKSNKSSKTSSISPPQTIKQTSKPLPTNKNGINQAPKNGGSQPKSIWDKKRETRIGNKTTSSSISSKKPKPVNGTKPKPQIANTSRPPLSATSKRKPPTMPPSSNTSSTLSSRSTTRSPLSKGGGFRARRQIISYDPNSVDMTKKPISSASRQEAFPTLSQANATSKRDSPLSKKGGGYRPRRQVISYDPNSVDMSRRSPPSRSPTRDRDMNMNMNRDRNSDRDIMRGQREPQRESQQQRAAQREQRIKEREQQRATIAPGGLSSRSRGYRPQRVVSDAVRPTSGNLSLSSVTHGRGARRYIPPSIRGLMKDMAPSTASPTNKDSQSPPASMTSSPPKPQQNQQVPSKPQPKKIAQRPQSKPDTVTTKTQQEPPRIATPPRKQNMNVSPAKSTKSNSSSSTAVSTQSGRSTRSSKSSRAKQKFIPSEQSKKYLDLRKSGHQSLSSVAIISRDNRNLHDVASIKTELTKKIAENDESASNEYYYNKNEMIETVDNPQFDPSIQSTDEKGKIKSNSQDWNPHTLPTPVVTATAAPSIYANQPLSAASTANDVYAQDGLPASTAPLNPTLSAGPPPPGATVWNPATTPTAAAYGAYPATHMQPTHGPGLSTNTTTNTTSYDNSPTHTPGLDQNPPIPSVAPLYATAAATGVAGVGLPGVVPQPPPNPMMPTHAPGQPVGNIQDPFPGMLPNVPLETDPNEIQKNEAIAMQSNLSPTIAEFVPGTGMNPAVNAGVGAMQPLNQQFQFSQQFVAQPMNQLNANLILQGQMGANYQNQQWLNTQQQTQPPIQEPVQPQQVQQVQPVQQQQQQPQQPQQSDPQQQVGFQPHSNNNNNMNNNNNNNNNQQQMNNNQNRNNYNNNNNNNRDGGNYGNNNRYNNNNNNNNRGYYNNRGYNNRYRGGRGRRLSYQRNNRYNNDNNNNNNNNNNEGGNNNNNNNNNNMGNNYGNNNRGNRGGYNNYNNRGNRGGRGGYNRYGNNNRNNYNNNNQNNYNNQRNYQSQRYNNYNNDNRRDNARYSRRYTQNNQQNRNQQRQQRQQQQKELHENQNKLYMKYLEQPQSKKKTYDKDILPSWAGVDKIEQIFNGEPGEKSVLLDTNIYLKFLCSEASDDVYRFLGFKEIVHRMVPVLNKQLMKRLHETAPVFTRLKISDFFLDLGPDFVKYVGNGGVLTKDALFRYKNPNGLKEFAIKYSTSLNNWLTSIPWNDLKDYLENAKQLTTVIICDGTQINKNRSISQMNQQPAPNYDEQKMGPLVRLFSSLVAAKRFIVEAAPFRIDCNFITNLSSIISDLQLYDHKILWNEQFLSAIKNHFGNLETFGLPANAIDVPTLAYIIEDSVGGLVIKNLYKFDAKSRLQSQDLAMLFDRFDTIELDSSLITKYPSIKNKTKIKTLTIQSDTHNFFMQLLLNLPSTVKHLVIKNPTHSTNNLMFDVSQQPKYNTKNVQQLTLYGFELDLKQIATILNKNLFQNLKQINIILQSAEKSVDGVEKHLYSLLRIKKPIKIKISPKPRPYR